MLWMRAYLHRESMEAWSTSQKTQVSNSFLVDDKPFVVLVEVHSAFGHDDLLKIKMYQYEQRYGSQDGQDGAHRRNTSQIQDIRPVSVIDYQEYRKLEDKRDRIMLKKLLYERKKVTDETQVVILNEELNLYQRNKNDLANQLEVLRKQLNALQNDIVTVDKTRMQEMHKVEQEKRRDIIKRAGRDVPY